MRIHGLCPILGFPDMNQDKRSANGAAAPEDLFQSLRMTPPDAVSIVRALGVPPHQRRRSRAKTSAGAPVTNG
jgi:hypothetical protein